MSAMAPDPRHPTWEAKIDQRLRALLARTQERPEEANQIVNVFVRFTGHAESLRAHGVMVRTVAGDIATASIALSDISKVASAPEILFMELSRPVGPDSSSPVEDQASTSE